MHDDDKYGTVATLHDATVRGDLVALLQGVSPDVAWMLTPPADVEQGEIYAFRHGVTTTIITKRRGDDEEHDGPGSIQRQDTHTHGTVEGAQLCIERNVIKFCHMGALVVSGPYVYVPPAPPTTGHPLLDMIAQAMGIIPQDGSAQVTQGDQVPGFADLATLLREQGITLDGTED